ncbi:hypothetical protein ElyMa_000101400 [Elysia marginata]|uniref:Uncharacterized protein n=1 Tax=Elysia marginata TaxID=1093978 RepID=A0AAV4EKZ7_9GAST|nr:hypothetical protein ElyMa_000101400 [Elysia marginata]
MQASLVNYVEIGPKTQASLVNYVEIGPKTQFGDLQTTTSINDNIYVFRTHDELTAVSLELDFLASRCEIALRPHMVTLQNLTQKNRENPRVNHSWSEYTHKTNAKQTDTGELIQVAGHKEDSRQVGLH